MKNERGNMLVKATKTSVASQLRTMAELVESGQISNYEITQKGDCVTFTADSRDGNQRVIKQQHDLGGLKRELTEYAVKQSPEQRLKVVKELVAEGKTQAQIAKRTITSQKTISNDIKKLRARGQL